MDLASMNMAVSGLLVVGVGACAKWLRSIDKHMMKTSSALDLHFGVTHPAMDKRLDRIEDRIT